MSDKAGIGSSTGIVTVDLRRIAENWTNLSRLVAPAECAAVVKADAYGLGADRVIPALYRAGCRTFFIATPDEALAARSLAPDARILALDGLIPGSVGAFAELGVRPVLSTIDDVRLWTMEAPGRAAALQFDSGLHRLGLSPADMRLLAGDAVLRAPLNISLIISHLACADDPSHPKNRQQLALFRTLAELYPRAPRSLAASDGLMLGADYHFDLVRPGYALYGGQASRSTAAPVKPAVKVEARILSVFDVAAGDTVGYSATWQAQRASRLATIAAGYADGIPRSASAASGATGGSVIVGGVRVAIAGRVSMDLITADVTEVPPYLARPGAMATLVGDGLSIEDAGFAAGTIGYEILTRLGRRFERRYIGEALQ